MEWLITIPPNKHPSIDNHRIFTKTQILQMLKHWPKASALEALEYWDSKLIECNRIEWHQVNSTLPSSGSGIIYQPPPPPPKPISILDHPLPSPSFFHLKLSSCFSSWCSVKCFTVFFSFFRKAQQPTFCILPLAKPSCDQLLCSVTTILRTRQTSRKAFPTQEMANKQTKGEKECRLLNSERESAPEFCFPSF